MLKLRAAMLDQWRATIANGALSTVTAAPEPDEPAPITTARTLMIAYAAQCGG